MAAIKCLIVENIGRQDRTALIAVWTAVTETDTFSPLAMLPEYINKSVHISSTFGGSTVVLKGSNNGTTYVGLNDLQDTAISMTSEGLEQVQENVLWYQPVAAGGNGQSLVVTMLFVKPSQPRG